MKVVMSAAPNAAEVDHFLLHCGTVVRQARKAAPRGLHTLEGVAASIPTLDAEGLSKFERGLGTITFKNFVWLILLLRIPLDQLFEPMLSSTAERLLACILKTPPRVQESLLFCLEYREGSWLPTDTSSVPLACLATSETSA